MTKVPIQKERTKDDEMVDAIPESRDVARDALRDFVKYLAEIAAQEDYNHFVKTGRILYSGEEPEGKSP